VHAPVSAEAARQLAMVVNLKDPLRATAHALEEEARPNHTVELPAGGFDYRLNRRRCRCRVSEIDLLEGDIRFRLNPIKHQRRTARRLHGRSRRGAEAGRTASDQDRAEGLRRDVADS